MSSKTMYIPTEIQDIAKQRTANNMRTLYRESAHHQQINKSKGEPVIEKAETPQAEEEVDEIKKAEETIISHCIENMILKGEISDALGRGYGPGSEPIRFTKTGKEIKEKIPGILTNLTLEKGKIVGQMEEIAKEVGIEPTIARNSYTLPTVSCMSYDWALCNPKYDEMNKCYPEPSTQNQLCNKYNSLGYMLISLSEDIATLTVMQGNLEDSKKYTMSVSQLIALGF